MESEYYFFVGCENRRTFAMSKDKKLIFNKKHRNNTEVLVKVYKID